MNSYAEGVFFGLLVIFVISLIIGGWYFFYILLFRKGGALIDSASKTSAELSKRYEKIINAILWPLIILGGVYGIWEGFKEGNTVATATVVGGYFFIKALLYILGALVVVWLVRLVIRWIVFTVEDSKQEYHSKK